MGARKRTAIFAASARLTTKPATFTAAERKALEPLIIRAALAAMKQSKAEAAYLKACEAIGGNAERLKADRLAIKERAAQAETCAAGAALDKAIKAARRGAK